MADCNRLDFRFEANQIVFGIQNSREDGFPAAWIPSKYVWKNLAKHCCSLRYVDNNILYFKISKAYIDYITCSLAPKYNADCKVISPNLISWFDDVLCELFNSLPHHIVIIYFNITSHSWRVKFKSVTILFIYFALGCKSSHIFYVTIF